MIIMPNNSISILIATTLTVKNVTEGLWMM